jgi:hypothetical protein
MEELKVKELRNAIQTKYGVSKKTSGQVIKVLTEIERQRQVAIGLPGRPGPGQSNQQVQQVQQVQHAQQAQQAQEVPNIESLIGGVLGGGSSQRGGLLGLILTILLKLFGMGGSSSQSQSGNNVTSILNDLMGGAIHPGQAPDLSSVLGGLLGGSTGSGGQASDIESMVTTLLGGGQRSSRGGRSR